MSITDDVDNAVELAFDKGVAHERKRIRRELLAQLNGFIGPATKLDIMEFIDAATRAPGTKRRGK